MSDSPEPIEEGSEFLPSQPGPDLFDLDPDYSVPVADPYNPFVFDFFQVRSPSPDEIFNDYRIQFFRELPVLSPHFPTPGDAGPPDSDLTLNARALILSLDMGLGDFSGIDPELRSFQPSLLDWKNLITLSGGTSLQSATIWWNVVALTSPGELDGSWGNALRFVVGVPEPSTFALVMFVTISFAGFYKRVSRRATL
jgi:hypothetical protein